MVGVITAPWQMPEQTDGVDTDGRLLKREVAEDVAARITGKTASVERFESRPKQRPAPMP